MIYTTEPEAQLECDLLNRKHEDTGRTWEPGIVKHAGWKDIVPKNYWQPVEVTPDRNDHDALAMHARRTCYHNTGENYVC